MKIQDSVQCHACNSILSHPVDACPVCGDQFYWLVTTKSKPSENEKESFLARMEELVEGASREFLNHDNHLWLPYRFWDNNPSGETLDSFSWISGVQLFQHETELADVPVSEYDTLPKIPIPEWVRAGPSGADGKKPHPHPIEARPEHQVPKQHRAPAPSPSRAMIEDPTSPIIPSQMFLPLMIFLFLILLSFSYLTLRYHKNHRWQSSQAVPEASHESSVLP